MINSCKCNSTNDPYPILKCSHCGCMHYKRTKPPSCSPPKCPPPSCSPPRCPPERCPPQKCPPPRCPQWCSAPCSSLPSPNVCHSWVDKDTLPKRKDIVPGKNEGNGNQKRTSSGTRQKPAEGVKRARSGSRQKSAEGRKSSSDRKRSSKRDRQASLSQSKGVQTPPATNKIQKQDNSPSTSKPSATNGDKSKTNAQVQNLPSSSDPKAQPIILPTASQSEQILSRSGSARGNYEFTEKFCCFLKKVKSTEMFIRNLFKEELKTSPPPPPPPDNCRATCGICVDPCKTIGDLVCIPVKCDTNGDKSKSQTVDLAEIKNTVECLKEMMCKQSQNGCTNDESFQRILAELKKYVQQDTIDKLLKPTNDNTVALVTDSTAPFVFIKCRPFCDQHGVFIVEWKVTSFLGIGGYEIYMDGVLKQTICSAIRNTALIPDVNPKCDHLVSIKAVPLPDCTLNSNDQWAPASCRYKPSCYLK